MRDKEGMGGRKREKGREREKREKEASGLFRNRLWATSCGLLLSIQRRQKEEGYTGVDVDVKADVDV